jgi:DNA-binding HxlR family transcriptional regulator
MESKRKENSTNNINRNDTLIVCPFMRALTMIEGRWKLVVICRLRDNGNLSFSKLQELIPLASKRMISKVLKELLSDRIIARNTLGTFPQTVEYSLTEHGIALLPVIEQLKEWGLKVKPAIDN